MQLNRGDEITGNYNNYSEPEIVRNFSGSCDSINEPEISRKVLEEDLERK